MKFVFPLFVSLVLLPSSSLAKKAPKLSDFCERPYETVCGPHVDKKQKREKRIASLTKKITEKAWQEYVLTVVPDAKWEEIPFGTDASKTLSKRQEQIATLYFKGINKELRELIGSAFEHYKPAFAQVREFLFRTFISRLNRVRPDDVEKMKTKLDPKNLKYIDALEVLANDKPVEPDVLSSVIENCGRDGLTDNAFATEGEKFNYLIICPGDYLGSFDPDSKTGVSAIDLAGELWTMGHELGHHIDSEIFPASYAKLESCVADNYVDQLGQLDDQGQREQLKKEDVPRYMREISADYWGTEALADVVKSVKNPGAKLYVLQDSLESLCKTPDDGRETGHPDGRFRIENFVRRNPRLSAALGCDLNSSRETKPSCTLRGAWHKKFW